MQRDLKKILTQTKGRFSLGNSKTGGSTMKTEEVVLMWSMKLPSSSTATSQWSMPEDLRITRRKITRLTEWSARAHRNTSNRWRLRRLRTKTLTWDNQPSRPTICTHSKKKWRELNGRKNTGKVQNTTRLKFKKPTILVPKVQPKKSNCRR